VTGPVPVVRVGAYAVIQRDGAVLLARFVGSDPPRWTLPGGGLDHGEDPRDGAVREVEEETGYRVELRRLLTVESFRALVDRPAGPIDHHVICIVTPPRSWAGSCATRSAAPRTPRRGSRWGTCRPWSAARWWTSGSRRPGTYRLGSTGRSAKLLGGSVSERPKEHASKACEVQASVGSNPTATAS
jgi:ADP-ribose pyrophosphatase YjhB (NUDIX family)